MSRAPIIKNSDGCTIFDYLMINKIYKSIHIIKIIKLLLENNINIDTYNIHGYALLHYYICEKKYDIVNEFNEWLRQRNIKTDKPLFLCSWNF